METSGRLRAASARSSVSASASVAAGGRSSAPAQRIASGIAAAINSSTVPWPTVFSMAATSSGDGPMCRAAKECSVIGSTPRQRLRTSPPPLSCPSRAAYPHSPFA